MLSGSNHRKFEDLRQAYPYLVFEDLKTSVKDHSLHIKYNFNLSGKFLFEPEIFIPQKSFLQNDINDSELFNLAFHIGMVELVSYWKATCSPLVTIRPVQLSQTQSAWWKKLYYFGLGEFFYTNGIRIEFDQFMEIESDGVDLPQTFTFDPGHEVILPVGGGKDSVVSLEILKKSGKSIIPFIINPRKASLETAGVAGYTRDEIFEVTRTLDPRLLELNRQGFLNGHTPFSAVIAFISLLAARMTNNRNIALSNESSANEATIPGTKINHQYSKSWEFERDFRDYTREFISADFNYFSLLRPVNELQIARIFSKYPEYFGVFKSCNTGSKTDSWCGKCPKCLFTWIILQPFLSAEELETIFGKNLLHDKNLLPLLKELTGNTGEKPFECVGTIDEVNSALHEITKKYREGDVPVLLRQYRKNTGKGDRFNFQAHLHHFNSRHFLEPEFENLIRKKIS